MLPEVSEKARSEVERVNENSKRVATSEGEKLKAVRAIRSDWYDQPQEKRVRVTKEEAKPLRRSKRFTPEQNERLDKLEIIEEEAEEIEPKEQQNFGL
jgi:hypothetical protein